MPAGRNPPWSRDELILALDFYFRYSLSALSAGHPEVIALSGLLNRLRAGLAPRGNADFRSPASVYLKLCNFLRLDPAYPGAGLRYGGRLEIEVWEEFAGDRERLRQTAAQIASCAAASGLPPQEDPEEEEFPEGKLLYRMHRARERSRALVLRAKQAALRRSGVLRCAVCGFSFAEAYGELGEGFIECHHTVPVSMLDPQSKTRVSDLILVCSNCHRMLHRRAPALSPERLAEAVRRQRGAEPAAPPAGAAGGPRAG